jgi:hypothetical protein
MIYYIVSFLQNTSQVSQEQMSNQSHCCKKMMCHESLDGVGALFIKQIC